MILYEYHLLLSILLKVFKVVVTFLKFLPEKDEFCIQEWTKEVSKEVKRQGKRLEATRKNHIDKNKEK